MTAITSLLVNVQTHASAGAGTDGDVYVGFAGREFWLDTNADDFEAGSSRTYRLGDGSNVRNPDDNDPRDPALQVEMADRFPVWVRFTPRSRTDNWVLARATITLNDRLFPMWDTAEWLAIRSGLTLGERSGLVAFLLRHQDSPPVGQPKS
jgi:hypothetical protein